MEDWLIYIYIYIYTHTYICICVCEVVHQTMNFLASAEILIGF